MATLHPIGEDGPRVFEVLSLPEEPPPQEAIRTVNIKIYTLIFEHWVIPLINKPCLAISQRSLEGKDSKYSFQLQEKHCFINKVYS